MNSTSETEPRALLAGVLVLTLIVLALGGAVVAVKLRPKPIPTDRVNREIVLWQRAVDAAPGDSRAHTGLGMAYLQADQPQDARGEFEQAIELDETAWLAAFQLALLVETEDPGRAQTLLKQAVANATDQDRQAPLIALGDLLMAGGDAQGAASAYRKSIAIDPFTLDAHFGLGTALEALGQKGAALKEYEEAKRFDPSNQAVADAIARLNG